MTDDVRGEFTNRDIAEDIIIEHCEKESFDDMRSAITNALNEAYAKGRQSVLDKIPNEQLVDTEILKILKLDFTHTYSLKVFYKWLISKLSDDKGG